MASDRHTGAWAQEVERPPGITVQPYVRYRTDLSAPALYSSRQYEIQQQCLSEAGLTVNRWQEHLPVASMALSGLLERAVPGGAPFSAAERALFTACEFWVAIETRTLTAHLGPHDADPLRYLSIVYSAMGAHHVAQLLIAGVAEMGPTPTPPERLKSLTALQERVSRTRDPVDQLISGLARNLGLCAVPRPDRRVDFGTETSARLPLSWSRRGSPPAWWAINP